MVKEKGSSGGLEQMGEKEITTPEPNGDKEKTIFTEYELSEDLKDFIMFNSDVTIAKISLKKEIYDYPDGTLLKVDKEIGSATKIISVEEATEEVINNNF